MSRLHPFLLKMVPSLRGSKRRYSATPRLAFPERLEGRALLAGVVLPNLPAGSKYQIMFVTAGTRLAESVDISTYNAFVTNEASFSQALPAATWRAWASTAMTNASDNAPTYTDVPIYNTRGQLIATNSSEFLYPIHRATQAFDQFGLSANRQVWTGSDYRGKGILNKTLGLERTQWADANNYTDSLGWVSVGEDYFKGYARSIYVISSVLTVGGTAAAPSAPSGLFSVPGNASVALTWNAPSSTGDSAISDYKIQSSVDGTTWNDFSRPASNATSATVTGLTNGQSYIFRVSAVNRAGTGSFTAPTTPVIPKPPSGATSGVVLPNLPAGSKYQIMFVTAGTRMAESADISTYNNYVTSEAGFSQSLPKATWRAWASTAMTNASDNAPTYTDVPIYNTRGRLIAMNSSEFLYPIHRATQAFDQFGLSANRQVWTGSDYRGKGILNKTLGLERTQWADANNYTDSLGWVSVGEDYFKGYARSMYAISSVITVGETATVPSAPSGLTAVPGNTSVVLTWNAPSATGDSAISDYRIQSSSDGKTWTDFIRSASDATSATVTGLTNGLSYVFRVSAVNRAGTGSFTAPTAPVTPRTIPNAPTNLVGFPRNGQVRLTWSAPLSNGGSPITDYRIQFSRDGISWSDFARSASTATSATVTGLTNGLSYVLRVSAVNQAGTGSFTAQTPPITPRTIPNAPTNLVGFPRNSQVSLTWSAPLSNGGSPITDYVVQYKTNTASAWITANDGISTATSATVTGLTNGTAYMFRVAATNAAGTGAVAAVKATPVSHQDVIAGGWKWFNGETYRFLADGQIVQDLPDGRTMYRSDARWQRSADNASRYLFSWGNGTFRDDLLLSSDGETLRGKNQYGGDVTGRRTASPSSPAAPTSLRGVSGNGLIKLTWAVPASNGGLVITDYVVQYRVSTGSSWVTVNDGLSATSAAVVTGLTNGTSYVFRVAAVNATGRGAFSVQTIPIKPQKLPTVLVPFSLVDRVSAR